SCYMGVSLFGSGRFYRDYKYTLHCCNNSVRKVLCLYVFCFNRLAVEALDCVSHSVHTLRSIKSICGFVRFGADRGSTIEQVVWPSLFPGNKKAVCME